MATKAKKKTTKVKEPKLRITVRHALTNIYVVLMFTLFPLFLSNRYSNARRDKFWFLVVLTAIIGVSVGILTLVDYFTKNSPYSQRLYAHHDPFKATATDAFFASFTVFTVVSSLLSGDFSHSFLGVTRVVQGTKVSYLSDGRCMGLLAILMLFAAYLLISRFFYFDKWIIYCAFGAMAFVALLSVVNYYYFDPFKYFEYYKGSKDYENTLKNFTSTIGNKNYLSATICVTLPFSLGMALASKDYIMRTVAYISTGIHFMGLIVATSDGGFLGLFALLLAIFVMVSRNTEKLKRFFFALTIMAFSSRVLYLFDLIITANGGKSKGYASFSYYTLFGNFMYIVLAILALITVGLHFLDIRMKGEPLPHYVFYIALGIVSAVVLAIAALFINYSFIDTESKVSGFKKFFRFNEYWGTHRGFFWIRAIDIFKNDLSFTEKLFGTGPDSFYYAFEPYFKELAAFTRNKEGTTNSAHNVYINYLITHGIVGLVSYLGLVISSIVLSVRRARTNPLAFVSLCVIIAYAAQDIINIANPVNTPWFIMFIALSEATNLKANSTQRLEAIKF